MLLVLKNFRLVDETTDTHGSIIVEDGIIKEVYPGTDDGLDFVLAEKEIEQSLRRADAVLDGGSAGQNSGQAGSFVLMPAFVDLHAHFREPGFSQKETLESASLAAAAGGYGTIICMANTKPVTDTIERACYIKNRCDALGLVDVYPVLSLTKGMEGKELSEITLLNSNREEKENSIVRLLSEDGKDVADDKLFLSAMKEARRLGVSVSCHCDLDGENNAAKRALELGEQAQCRIHIAHVSTKEAAAMVRQAKKKSALFTCEVTPHHLALAEKDAVAMGAETHGQVNPPLRTEEDRQALIEALVDGTVDVIATDHAPHTNADKENGAPGFTGLETAFAVCYSTLVKPGNINLSKLSSLMSAAPARILGLDKENAGGRCGRGKIAPGLRADFAIADISAAWTVEPGTFMSRGKNSPFAGKELTGKIIKTIRGGRFVFDQH